MNKPVFKLATVFAYILWATTTIAAEDSDYKEAQDAVLRTLDLPLGASGKHTLHIRLAANGQKAVYELWKPTLRITLEKGDELSAADRLNGDEQVLWKGKAMLAVDALRQVTNSDAIGNAELKYQRWQDTPSNSAIGSKDRFMEFSMSKTSHGWRIKDTTRGTIQSGNPPYDKTMPLFTEPTETPVATSSKDEVEIAFRQMFHTQDDNNLLLVERTLATPPEYINHDRYHEFHAPSFQFEILPSNTARNLNGDAMASARVLCQAHRFPKTVKSRTRMTPASLPQELNMWQGEDPGLKWLPAPDQSSKGDCDYIGIRRDGKWTFTIAAYLSNNEWLNKVVLVSKGEVARPEENLAPSKGYAKAPLTGIGVSMAIKGNSIEIIRVEVGGPAEKSGEIHVGDKIVAVAADDPPTFWGNVAISETSPKLIRDRELSDVQKMIRGEAGKAVNFKIQPTGTNDPSEIKIVRIVRAELGTE